MSHRIGAAVAAVCMLLLVVVPASAQDVDGRVITALVFTGLKTLPEETVSYYLGLEVGQRLDTEDLNERLHSLWDTQLIEDISIDSTVTTDGVILRIHAEERPVLISVEYEGNKKVSRNDILDRIAEDNIAVREGDYLSRGELERLEGAIEALYAEKGYRLATARHRIETVSPGERRVYFAVDEGDKVRIGDIDFEGNTVFSDRRLRFSMKKTKESGLITKVTKRDVFSTAKLEEDLERVRELYRSAGYKNVILGETETEVYGKGGDTDLDGKRRLAVTVPIEEGARWRLGEIDFEGNDKYPDELLASQFQRSRGDWLRSNLVDEGLEAVNEIYSNTGYLFSRVDREIIEREDNIADLIVKIDEGDQYRIGRVEFRGNTRTRDKVLRRELGNVQEGLVLNTGALRNSLLRIRQLEFFKVDEEDPVEFDFNNEQQTVDLLIKGEEGDRTEMTFGGGFSEFDGFFGTFSFRTRNFLGRGESVGVALQSGRLRDSFDLSYFIPWFLDRPQSVGIQASQRSFEYDLLSGQEVFQDSRGGTLTYGRNLGLFRSLSLSYSLLDVEDIRTALTLAGELVEQNFTRKISSTRLSYSFNRVDSRFEPTNGSRHTLSLEYAGDILGGDTSYFRPRGSFSLYRPVTKAPVATVFGVNAEAGYIRALADDTLFTTDRFYIGGENSIRGFRTRSVWARDDEGNSLLDEFGFPLGGDSFLQFNLEYHFLTGGPFRVLLFGDAGAVFADGQSIDVDRFRYTAGVEFRVTVPIFGQPLRFIYANNLDPLPDDRFESFQFSVGTTF